MALYEYDLYLARAAHDESLLTTLIRERLLEPGDGGENFRLSCGGRCFAREGALPTPLAWQVVELMLDDFEACSRSFTAFVDWIFRAAQAANLTAIIMPSGPDVRHRSEPSATLEALASGRGIGEGHPLVFVAQRFVGPAPDRPLPYYRVCERLGIGIVFVTAHVEEDDSFEILDMGPDDAFALGLALRRRIVP